MENKMGVRPVPRLLLGMGAPLMLSMLAQALYNVVDSFFVSHMADTPEIAAMGDRAVNALTLAFPIQMLIIAVGVGTGVGINAVLARCLGQGDRGRASRTAGNAMFVSICYYLLFLAFGLFGTAPFIRSQTQDPAIAAMGVAYLRIITVFSFGTIGFQCFEKTVMATGKTVAAMLGQLSGALTNIVLDPIMIFGYLGCPALGVAGAAYATVIGQCVSFSVILVLHFRRNKEIENRLSYLIPRADILKPVYAVGAPAILMQALTSFMTYGMNLILGSVSVSAVTAYGVYYKLQNFIYMPAYGLNNASIPIISYNYGARQKGRIRAAIRSGLLMVSGIMAAGILLLQLFSPQIVGLFAISEDSISLCVCSLRIVTCGFLFAGVNILLQGVCQALGNGLYSLLISLLRLIVLVLPAAYLLSRLPNAANTVWIAIPAAEAAACAAAALLTRRLFRARFPA